MTMSAFASIPLQLGRILSVTTNLRELDLRSTASAMTDNVMRVICCYLTQLTHLNLKGCHNITAFGFLGPNNKEAPTHIRVVNEFVNFLDTGHDISNLKKLVNLNISGLNIGDEVFEYLKVCSLKLKIILSNVMFFQGEAIINLVLFGAISKLLNSCFFATGGGRNLHLQHFVVSVVVPTICTQLYILKILPCVI